MGTGSGPAILTSAAEVEENTWHQVKIKRKLREGSLVFDKEDPVTETSPGNTRGLNIRTPVYIGGLNLQKYEYADQVGVTKHNHIRRQHQRQHQHQLHAYHIQQHHIQQHLLQLLQWQTFLGVSMVLSLHTSH